MKTILIILFIFPVLLFSQESLTLKSSDTVGVDAEFPGGFGAYKVYLSDNFIYPKKSLEKGEQGKIYIQFVVEKDGSITQVKILEGLTRRLNKEAIRVIKNMPKWTPAELNGEIVRARCKLPINLILTDD